MPVRHTNSARRSLRSMAKEAKASGLAEPPPKPEPDEMIEMPLVRAHSMEFTFRLSGLTILIYLTYLAVQFWRIMRDGGDIGLAVFYALIAAFFAYIWRMGRVFQLMMRSWNARDLQAAGRRTLNQRIAALDDRERSLDEREKELDQREGNVKAIEAALDEKVMTEEQKRITRERSKAARQAAELAEIAPDLEKP